MWQPASQIISSPARQCTRTPTRFDMVPEGTYKAASLPSISATRSCSRLTVGSSPKTSSPTSASAIAERIGSVGLVTVSLRKSRYRPGMGRFLRGATGNAG